MCARMNDADQASSTEKWFTEAQKNIRGAKRLSGKRDLDRLTIFHLQQAMEMTVKGLATAHGRTHGQLKEFSHNYIELYVSLLEEILEGSGLITVINGVLSAFYEEGSSYDAIKHLSNTRDHVLSPRSSRKRRTDADWKRIYLSAFQISPEDVRNLIKAYDQLKDAPALEGAGREILRHKIAQDRGIQPADVGTLEVNKALTTLKLQLRALVGLIIFGCVFWPHNMASRYPAPPNTEPDIWSVQDSSMIGAEHYSPQLGVVKHLKILRECCEEVVNTLVDGHRNRPAIFSNQERSESG